MTLVEACGLALLRAAASAGIAVTLARPLARRLRSRDGANHIHPSAGRNPFARDRPASGAWLIVLAVLLAPAIAVGYAYGHSVLALVRHPWLNELVYLALITLKFTPVAALVVLFAPPAPMSPTASHLLTLSPATQTWRWRLVQFTRGPGHHLMLAAALVALLSFQEFEIASLMGISTWTVWLFDAQVGGLALEQSLRYALWPAACELLLMVSPALYLLLRDPPGTANVSSVDWALCEQTVSARGSASWPERLLQRLPGSAALAYLLLAALIVVLIPLGVITKNAIVGLGAVSVHSLLLREIGVSLLFAVAASIISWTLAGLVVRWVHRGRHGISLALLIGVTLPGLVGGLVLGLVMVRLFQLPMLQSLYGTVTPAIAALSVLLLPIAVLAHLVLDARKPTQALHNATLLAHPTANRQGRSVARAIRWHLHLRPRVWACMLLLYLAFFDLSATAILHPPDMTPVTHRMYNLMHYGQLPTLFAAVAVTILTPVLLAGVVALTIRLLRPKSLS